MMEEKPLDHSSPFRIPKREGGSPPKEMFVRKSSIETKPLKMDNNVTPEQNGGGQGKKPDTRTPDSHNRKRPYEGPRRQRRGPRPFDTPCTSSARHQIAPLDSIMDEMTGQVKRAKQEAAERALRSETNEAVADAAVRELTKAALELHAKDDKMAYDFSNRDELMERLLGYKMLHGRLEGFPAMGYVRMDERERLMAVVRSPDGGFSTPRSGEHGGHRRGGPRTPPHPCEFPNETKPSPLMQQPTPTRPRGPRTPPGSPGPHTPPPPPCAPPPPEVKTDPLLTHMAALAGQDAGQLEAYLGEDMMKTLGAVSKDVLLQKLKEVLSGHVQQPNEARKGRTPSPPRRNRDQESVKMELVSDCSLSPEPGDLSQEGIPAPPPPPVIAPPPAPPILPPIAARPPIQNSYENQALPVWPGTADSSPSPPRKNVPSYLPPPPNFAHCPPFPGPPAYQPYNPPTTGYNPVSSMPYHSDMMTLNKPPPPPIMAFSTPPAPKPTTILPTVRITAKVTTATPQLPTTPVASTNTQPPPLQFMTPPVQINQPPPMMPSNPPPPMGMAIPPPSLSSMSNIPPPMMGMPPSNGYSMPPPMMNTSMAPPPIMTGQPFPTPVIQDMPPMMMPNMSAPPPMMMPQVAPVPTTPEVTVAPAPRAPHLPLRFDPTMASGIHWNDSPPSTPAYQAPVQAPVQTATPVVAPPLPLMAEPIMPPPQMEAAPIYTPQKTHEPTIQAMPNVANTLMSALFGGIGKSANQDSPQQHQQQQQQQQSFNPLAGLGPAMGGPGGPHGGPFGPPPGMGPPGGFNHSPMMQQQHMPQQNYGTPNRTRGGHKNQNQNRKGGQGGRPYRPK